MTFDTAPVVGATRGEPGVTESQLRFGEVTPDEVSVLIGERFPLKTLFGVEQAGAAIEEEPGCFVQGDAGCVTVMFAGGKQGGIPNQPLMTHDEVVVEHTGLTADKTGEREDFEFDLDSGLGCQLCGELMQGLAVASII